MRAIAILTSFLLLSGCVSMETALEHDAKVDKKRAYLYGKFKLEGDASGTKIALAISNRINEKYIAFQMENDVYAVDLPAGHYLVGKVVFLNSSNRITFEKYLNPDKPAIEIALDAGKAYYLGDYLGEATTTWNYPQYRLEWRLKRLEDNYDATTKSFAILYKNFASVETVNLIKTYRNEIFSELIQEMRELDKLIADKKYEEAVAIAKKHAYKDVPYAQNRLGYLYEKGWGLVQSHKDAAVWYRKAADERFSDAMISLGVLLLRYAPAKNQLPGSEWASIGSKGEGIDWINKAALEKNPRAMAIMCTFAADTRAPSDLQYQGYAWCELALKYISSKDSKLVELVNASYEKAKPLMTQELLNKAAKYKSDIQLTLIKSDIEAAIQPDKYNQ